MYKYEGSLLAKVSQNVAELMLLNCSISRKLLSRDPRIPFSHYSPEASKDSQVEMTEAYGHLIPKASALGFLSFQSCPAVNLSYSVSREWSGTMALHHPTQPCVLGSGPALPCMFHLVHRASSPWIHKFGNRGVHCSPVINIQICGETHGLDDTVLGARSGLQAVGWVPLLYKILYSTWSGQETIFTYDFKVAAVLSHCQCIQTFHSGCYPWKSAYITFNRSTLLFLSLFYLRKMIQPLDIVNCTLWDNWHRAALPWEHFWRNSVRRKFILKTCAPSVRMEQLGPLHTWVMSYRLSFGRGWGKL